MKPFNLNDFKAGKKVVTRDGREVKQLTVFDSKESYPLMGTIDGSIYSWDTNGLRYDKNNSSDFDLFHPEEEITIVINQHMDTLDEIQHTVNGAMNAGILEKIPHGTYKLVKVD